MRQCLPAFTRTFSGRTKLCLLPNFKWNRIPYSHACNSFSYSFFNTYFVRQFSVDSNTTILSSHSTTTALSSASSNSPTHTATSGNTTNTSTNNNNNTINVGSRTFSDLPISDKSKYVYVKPLLDTFAIIKDLEKSGFSRKQSEELFHVFRTILDTRLQELEKMFVSQIQVENDACLIKSKCHEIRLDLQILSNKNYLESKALYEKSLLEIQLLFEKLRDTTDLLMTDSKMRLHFYKGENREELQKIDSVLHKENGLLMITSADLKTGAESTKLMAIYSFAFSLIFSVVIMIYGKIFFFDEPDQKKKSPVIVYEEDATGL